MNQDPNKTLGSIIGGSLIISFFIFGLFYYMGQSADSKDALSVTGSAKTQITSDRAKLTIVVSRTVTQSGLAEGYEATARDVVLTKNLLRKEGAPEADILEGTISTSQRYDYNRTPGSEIQYEIRQTITVQSDDVEKLTAISKRVPNLAGQGAFATIQSLEYFYSKLPELRVSLLAEAVKDAKARAETIAAGSGRKVGGIKSAASGVVQLLPLNSVEVSDYGTYDTSSIEKDVMVTVKASFGLK